MRELVEQTLFPSFHEKTSLLASGEISLVHYTTAENAINILSGEEFWLRRSSMMNDLAEVSLGLEYIKIVVFGDSWDAFETALENMRSGLAHVVRANFTERENQIYRDCYIGCFSEHSTADMKFGRLSMWRAYAGTESVALVVNAEPIFQHSGYLDVFVTPVEYVDKERFSVLVHKTLQKLDALVPAFKVIDFEELVKIFTRWLAILAVTTKHPCFAEEKEWRAVSIPSLLGEKGISKTREIIGSVPQKVIKVELLDRTSDIDFDLSPKRIFSEVIIGPCSYPYQLHEEFTEFMEEIGASNTTVRISHLPLRR